jgi:hypothetical protein
MWKDCVRRLTEVSLVPAFSGIQLVLFAVPQGILIDLWSEVLGPLGFFRYLTRLLHFTGDEILAARTPTGATPITRSDRDVEVTAAVRSSLVSEDQESYHFSLLNSGKSSSFSLSELSDKRATNLPGGMENKPHKDSADQVYSLPTSLSFVVYSETMQIHNFCFAVL